jgi:hypothetical protein
MGRCVFMRRSVVWTLILLGVGLGRQPAGGQMSGTGLDRAHVAIGYVANAPDLMVGGGGYAIFDFLGGIGLYVDAKFDLETPAGEDTFEAGLTVGDAENQIGAGFIQTDFGYQSFNAALVRPLNSELAVYVGGGLVKLKGYRLYQDLDPASELGVSGVFWVEDTSQDEVRGNVMFGAFLRLNSFLSSQVGIETEPKGFTVGVSFRLPRH